MFSSVATYLTLCSRLQSEDEIFVFHSTHQAMMADERQLATLKCYEHTQIQKSEQFFSQVIT